MDELTRITHTWNTSDDGYTIVTGWGVPLAAGATRSQALTALFHRGLTPLSAVTALNAAVRIGHFTVAGLPTD